jgi:hypothetical protein
MPLRKEMKAAEWFDLKAAHQFSKFALDSFLSRMLDDVSPDPKQELKTYKVLAYAGFGLWWAAMIAGGYAPDGDERMYIVISAMAYALVVIIGLFATGYYAARRRAYDTQEKRREAWKSHLIGLPFACVLYVLISRYVNDDSWSDTLSGMAFLFLFLTLFTWFTEYHKSKS